AISSARVRINLQSRAMSQYPSPCSPPPQPQYYGYLPPPQDPLLAAKRASTMMFVLGPLVVLAGTCIALFSFAISTVQLPAEQQQMLQQLESKTGVSAHGFFLTTGILLLVPGLLMILLAFFV